MRNKSGKLHAPHVLAATASLALWGICAPLTALADSKSSCPPDDLPAKTSGYAATLLDRKLDMIRDVYGIYEEACDGGLYLVDLNQGQRLLRINENWWLYKFESAKWRDPESPNEIVTLAQYVTGIGPTGAQPFRARIVVKRAGRGWIAQEPEILGGTPGN